MERRDFRIANTTREKLQVKEPVFPSDESLDLLYREASSLAYKYNSEVKKDGRSDYVSPGKLHVTAVLHMVYQIVLSKKLEEDSYKDFFTRRRATVSSDDGLREALTFYSENFPSPALEEEQPDEGKRLTEDLRGYFVHRLMLDNPALLEASKPFLAPDGLSFPSGSRALSSVISSYVKDDLRSGEANTDDLYTFLQLPARLFPNSLDGQVKYVMREWKEYLPAQVNDLLSISMDYIREEEKDRGGWVGAGGGGPAPTQVTDYSSELNEYEAFSLDTDWMPRVVMIAKCTYVWLDQLSKQYKYSITRLDQIPDHELDLLQERGFTALWLIGLWERSTASKTIKNLCGNPEAEASAYSLKDYEISASIGGWPALENLRARCNQRGIKLASDMVPNHTGMDGNWVYEHPDYFIQQDWPPFPSYTYNGPDLSSNPRYEIKIEDHYYDKTDAAVTFRLTDKQTGQVRYIFHGNDGTTMPWNDTAQLDYLNPETREAVIQEIIHVAKNFQIIRFDAAMTLAKRHIQRLWYPKPGTGGDVAGRAGHAMSDESFNKAIPQEFWREVVDRIAEEVPDTLLLAEAFWMMEGYFVRTLGMHRVYNSAFMNMLKNQENEKYRASIKNTLIFEPEILKRYVNFMNNPDEETAIAQFGDGDRYFAIATLLATLPGLPMIGHGQIEGYREKYGMEYRRAYYNESPNQWLVGEHYRLIFPLFRKRYLFSNVDHFQLYDCVNSLGKVEESVYAFVNGAGSERTLVLVNNQVERVSGTINISAPKLKKDGEDKETVTTRLADNLSLSFGGKSYCLMDSFKDGLTYIFPSIHIFDEGLSVELNGYESRVYWNIREVQDTDGTYERIWKNFGGRGIKDIAKAVALIRLAPLHKTMDPLRSEKAYRLITAMVNGKLKQREENELILILAECYTKLPEVYATLEEPAKAQIENAPSEIDPKPMVKLIRALNRLFKKKISSIAAWASVDESLPVLLLASMSLYPYTRGLSPKAAMKTADSLLLDTFYQSGLKNIQYDEKLSRVITHAAALFSVADQYWDKDTLKAFSSIVSDEGVQNLAQCNEYQGIVWYNKEEMQRIIMLTALAWALPPAADKDFEIDVYVQEMLDKEIRSGYQLRGLLEKPEK